MCRCLQSTTACSSRGASSCALDSSPLQQQQQLAHLADEGAPDAGQAAGPLKHAVLLGQAVRHADLRGGRGGWGVPGEMAAAAQCRVSHQSYGCDRYTRQQLFCHNQSRQLARSPAPLLETQLLPAPSRAAVPHRLVLVHAAGCERADQAASAGAHCKVKWRTENKERWAAQRGLGLGILHRNWCSIRVQVKAPVTRQVRQHGPLPAWL